MADQPTAPGAPNAPINSPHQTTTVTNQPDLIAAPQTEEEVCESSAGGPPGDGEDPNYDEDSYSSESDSAVGVDSVSSSNSITASIMEYRNIKGRTYHSAKHESKYFTPNDEQQMESQDITHHYLTVMLDDRLFLAPVPDNVKRVLDVGTGTGIWAIDMGDKYPDAEVIGTDLSPTQPLWVPPNVKFEIDDCTKEWTWPEGYFDFIHMRYLFGAISDWSELLHQAYRCCAPGGWVQSCECDIAMNSDDDTIRPESVIKTFWNPLWKELPEKLGVSFQVVEEGLQNKGFEEAGFVDITEVNYKLPIGGWPLDRKLAEIGQLTLLTLNNDIEGYTLIPWNVVYGEETPGYQETLAYMRREIRSRSTHAYMSIRYVYGRKP
ncbi:S-adenosyl-L-methionine-dependent methyltransferase [Hypoxylon trugodes]|uniref:S-adenosyl-L-methionine-dependent methyltransferase n=1 Tax=Hypoxylon trugodes TaxID=326681 RepID=UPI0021990509|nr:S-adenosyl-L-methionine-dependent methyltransferase [Hypoxylon trugodes]KAI1384779.1 S-adenosyl-L-methionine-dependent methyltransferase [Hypoxylon trugodes]